MMMEALAALVTKGLTDREEHEVPEPEFKPFRFPEHEAATAHARALAPANEAVAPKTLEELGVPGPLARELESTLRAMGLARGDRVVGYSFATPGGTRHTLRLASEPGTRTTGLAA